MKLKSNKNTFLLAIDKEKFDSQFARYPLLCLGAMIFTFIIGKVFSAPLIDVVLGSVVGMIAIFFFIAISSIDFKESFK